ncbi:acyltransferase [Dysgonomonas macrotermitis]|uniref:Surface polysaccharide O-acyltransferase, integral membrane enzyme n=1 Tax=Dysgonomonas macrotermitis TaxID=1346286 RepID=A0A1M5BM50_9BACT|nr:acyltransferase family protein [Dysgonomonas macrotermitis]SHF43292.1 Surface polysaccharide O-acyltransferase, integral membrane enzyme [Dysgonomonas macrotermitis]
MTQKRDMLIWPNWLRAIAMMAVIMIHVSGEVVILNTSTISWHSANLWNSFSRFSVPIFFMLSGSFLLSSNKNTEIKPFLRRRLSRIIYPLFFWGFLYYIYNIYTSYNAGTLVDLSAFLNLTIANILNGSSFQFWFIYVLIGIYLIIPLLNTWLQSATEQSILYFLILCGIASCLMVINLGNINSIFIPFTGFTVFVVLGYYLFNKSFKNPKQIGYYSIVTFVLSCIGIALWTAFLNKNGGVFIDNAYNYSGPLVFVSSIAIFLFAKYSKLCSKQNKIIDLLSRYSYGIYLNHVLILIAFKHIGITYNFIHPVFSIPLLTIICLALSIGLLYILNKIPVLNKLTGV